MIDYSSIILINVFIASIKEERKNSDWNKYQVQYLIHNIYSQILFSKSMFSQ